MADLVITAANVKKGSNATLNHDYVAGESVTAGQPVYKKASDQKLYKTQCDGTAEEASFFGIALHAASLDQPVVAQTSGEITIGATTVAGTVYVVSATAGGIAPNADLVSTNKVTLIGYAKTTAILVISPLVTGVTI